MCRSRPGLSLLKVPTLTETVDGRPSRKIVPETFGVVPTASSGAVSVVSCSLTV